MACSLSALSMRDAMRDPAGCCSVYLADQQTRRSPSLFGHSTLQIWLPPSRANALHHAHHWTPAVKVEEEALRPGKYPAWTRPELKPVSAILACTQCLSTFCYLWADQALRAPVRRLQ